MWVADGNNFSVDYGITYPEICENAIFFTNTACVHTYPAYFPAVFGNFWKRSAEWKFFCRIRMWMVVSGNWWIRLHHSLGSSLHPQHYKLALHLLISLISSLISCVQINAAVINLHNQYFRDPSRCFWRFASFCILLWPSEVVHLHHRSIYMYQHTFSWLFRKI